MIWITNSGFSIIYLGNVTLWLFKNVVLQYLLKVKTLIGQAWQSIDTFVYTAFSHLSISFENWRHVSRHKNFMGSDFSLHIKRML